MSFWVYKCNTDQHEHQKYWGDWDDVFAEGGVMGWGDSEGCDQLSALKSGDIVIAHQSNREELVGLCEVIGYEEKDAKHHLMLKAIEEIRVSMPELKEFDERIESLKAYAQGYVRTIYSITTAEALHLIDVARQLAALKKTINSDT